MMKILPMLMCAGALAAFGADTNEVIETQAISRMGSVTQDPKRDPGIFGECWWANRFLSRHQAIEAWRGKTVDIVMIGDSIMQFWEWHHPQSWATLTAGRTVLNLGYGGDRTENVIWRLEHGELDGYTAKNVVLLIGTNNNASDKTDPANVATAIEKIVGLIRAKQPQARIILHPIFPRGNSAQSTRQAAARARNDKTNALVKEFAAREKDLVWVDFSDRLLDKSGWVPSSIMADELHPTDEGYAIWTSALKPALKK